MNKEIVKTADFVIEDLGIHEEWVYDIEVDDTHTFFANDILVHNSNYVVLDQWVIQNIDQKLTKNEIVDKIDNWIDTVFEPMLEDRYNKLAEYLNAVENRLVMKREAISDCAIFRAKKNYIINVYDNEHVRYAEPVLKATGVETNRTSTPLLVRDKLTECLKLIINENETELRQVVREFKKEYKNLELDKIAKPTGVSDIEKWIGKEGEIITGCPIHVRASIVYNNIVRKNKEYSLKYPLIQSGDKIKYVYLMNNNPAGSHVIAYSDYLPKEFGVEEYVDRNTTFEKTFLLPLESFTNLVGYNVRHSKTLFDLEDIGSSTKTNLQVNTNTTTEQKQKPKKKKRKNTLI